MAFVPAVNVVQTNVRGLLASQRVENVLNWEFGGLPNPTAVAELADNVRAGWVSHIIPVLTAAYTLVEVYATDQTSQTGSSATSTAPTPVVGTLGGLPAANNVALCLSHRTTSRGRSARGRTYLPCVTANVTTDQNHVSASHAANVIAAWNDFLTEVQAASVVSFVIVSRFHNKVPRTTALVDIVVNTLFTDLVVDSQRRRLPGRGA